MIKRTFITALAAIIVTGISCSGKNPEYSINFNPFFTSPDEVISQTDRQSENYYNNYILAKAYSKKKELKPALLYYANSCFTSKYNFSLRLFPQPVYAFLDSYSAKSPYFNDSVYGIASIFYQYNEHEYVVKFISLIKDDGSAVYRDAVILKARSMQKLNRSSDAEKELLALSGKYSDDRSVAEIFMKLGSVYESAGKYSDALSAYITIIKAMKEAWHDDIAVKRILYLVSSKGVKINDSENRIAVAESLFDTGNYEGAESYISDQVKSGNRDASILHLRILTRKKPGEAVKFMKQYEKKPEYAEFALANANELWEMGNKYAAVQIYAKISDTADKDIAERVLTRLSFYYEERSNPEMIRYMEMYRKNFPESSQSARFTWLMGRLLLKSGNYTGASAYFAQSIKKYPESPYTGNSRYWLFRLDHMKKEATEAEKIKLLQDLVQFNPESTHTLALVSEYSGKADIAQITSLYQKAKKSGDDRLMLLYHTMLFMKEGYSKGWSSRVSDLDSSITDRYKSFNRFFAGGSYKSGYGKNLNALEKYFAAGDMDSINRELNILPDNDKKVDLDTALALARFSAKYGHFNYSTFYAFRLLDGMDIQENLPLMSEEFAKSLYPFAFRECVLRECNRYNVEPEVVLAMMKAESNFNAIAVSPAGAIGLMQFMPTTARGVAKEIGITEYDLKDPCTSVKFSANYIAWLDRYYKGRIELMVAGYNAGVGNVDIWLKRFNGKDLDYISEFTPYPVTRDYIFHTKKYMIQYRSVYRGE